MLPRLSVIIPVYNERPFIANVLARVQAVPIDKEIIVVDDGSTDGTREFLRSVADEDVRVLLADCNHGKGSAIRWGFQEARGEVVIIQDADLEYDPQDIPALLAPIESGSVDVVYGNRFAGGRGAATWPQYLGNRITTLATSFVTHLRLHDAWVGYKVFRHDVLDTLDLRESGFCIEIEITMRLAGGGWRIVEVPISYRPRSHTAGKKVGWQDAVRALWCLVKYSSRPLQASGTSTPTRQRLAVVITLAWLLLINAAYYAVTLAMGLTHIEAGWPP